MNTKRTISIVGTAAMFLAAAGSLRGEIIIAQSGAIFTDHRGTLDPADDQFSVGIEISGVSPEEREGRWISNSTPSGGAYSDPNPITFGPFLVVGGQHTIQITDDTDEELKSNVLTIQPPAPVITATVVAESVVRHDNGPGLSDDTIQFEVKVWGSNGGPFYTLRSYPSVATSQNTALTATASSVTVTLAPAPVHGRTVVSFHDASYPSAAAHVLIEVPPASMAGAFILGRKDLGTGLMDLLGDPDNTHHEWSNYPSLRTVEMTAGSGGEPKEFMSEVIDLSGVERAIRFTGTHYCPVTDRPTIH